MFKLVLFFAYVSRISTNVSANIAANRSAAFRRDFYCKPEDKRNVQYG
ncbi:MAG: hypothetical protein H7X91_09390 [Burkholderiales bacterium]|nr:hypothetical protein [Burkholderiales bacterium]